MEEKLLDSLLEKRDFLEKISEISFKYSLLTKKFPLKRINTEKMKWLNEKFNSLINEVKSLVNAKQNIYDWVIRDKK